MSVHQRPILLVIQSQQISKTADMTTQIICSKITVLTESRISSDINLFPNSESVRYCFKNSGQQKMLTRFLVKGC